MKPIEKKIFREIKNKINEEDTSIPEKDGNWFYFSETKKNQERVIFLSDASIMRAHVIQSQRREDVLFGVYLHAPRFVSIHVQSLIIQMPPEHVRIRTHRSIEAAASRKVQ